MKKRLMAAVLSTVMAATMLATGSVSVMAADAAAANDPAVELIFTSVSVSGDSHTEAMYEFADKVEELSGGSVTCKCYDNGSLFSSENEFDALLNGDADLAYISFPTIKPLSSFYLGSRVINTREKEINCYDDMNGLLLRMPNSEAWLFLGEALGANPTPLSFSELYTALQTGAVDAQDNPLPSIESAKFYEVTKYIAITNHVVDSIMPCINGDTWNSMTEAQQEAVTEAMEYARDVNDTARLDREAELIKFFEEQGLTVTYPDINEFKEKVQAKYMENEDMIKDWDMDLYNEIQAMADTTTEAE